LTFWENATAATGESLNLLLYAYAIYCLLEYRLDRAEWRLTRLAVVYGLAITNNWAMIGFLPAFLIALVWIKGLGFFQGRFLLRMAGFGALGLLPYLFLPLVESLSGKVNMSFWELLRMQLVIQKNFLLAYPRHLVFWCGLTSLLPMLIISLRWPSSFGDVSVIGTMLTNAMFRVVHGLFLAVCLSVMFDPPYSPRSLGSGLPLLTFYYLTALSIGYFSGYFLLVFGTEPEKKWRPTSFLTRALNRLLVALVWVALVAMPVGLGYKNWPSIRENNGPHLGHLGAALAEGLSAKGAIVLSDDPVSLFLVEAALDRKGVANPHVLLDTRSLPFQIYQRNLVKRYPKQWPDFLSGVNLADPLDSMVLLSVVVQLSRTNDVFYLHPGFSLRNEYPGHPTFSYYVEAMHAKPQGLVYHMIQLPPDAITNPAPSTNDLIHNRAFWDKTKAELASLHKPAKLSERATALSDAQFVVRFYSRAANYWGVELQRSGRLDEAGRMFDMALELNPDNGVAWVNHKFNQGLRSGRAKPVELVTSGDDSISPRYQRFEDDLWREHVIRENGPFDELRSCEWLSRALAVARPTLIRQAAQQFLRIQTLDPANREAPLWLANMYLKRRLTDKTLEVVQTVRAQQTNYPITQATQLELIRLEAWAYAFKTNLPVAKELLDKARQKHPDEESLPETLSQIYLHAGQFTNALAAVEEQLRIAPDNLKALFNKGALNIYLQRYKEAVPPLDRVLQAEPKNDAALMNRAIAHLQSTNWDAAQRDYEALLLIRPHFHRAYFGLGQIFYERKYTRAAIANYELYLKHTPPNVLLDPDEVQSVSNRLKELRSGALKR
jgi:tetratricopeptide (TPR) repeat protein